MGLDIYLYKYDNFKAWMEYKTKRDDYENELNEKFPGESYKVIDARIKDWEALQIVRPNEPECIELSSTKYPEHYFKVGYFRSSYNDSGINHILRNSIDKDLYSIFDPQNSYEFQPNWPQVLYRAFEAQRDFNAYLKDVGGYQVFSMTALPNKTPPQSEKEAMDLFRSELDRNKNANDDFCYSSGAGYFALKKPYKVHGLIHGQGFMGPCTYVVYKSDDGMEYYTQALEIIIETCNWVLQQPDPNQYALHWSS